MKLPNFLCFRMNSSDAKSRKKLHKQQGTTNTIRLTNESLVDVDKKPSDSTVSTAASETPPRHQSDLPLTSLSGRPMPQVRMPDPQVRIPDIRRQHDWFNHWDVEGRGRLSKVEATNAIQQTYRSFDAKKLKYIIDALWKGGKIELDKDGMIGLEGMLRSQNGLVDVTLRTYQLALARARNL